MNDTHSTNLRDIQNYTDYKIKLVFYDSTHRGNDRYEIFLKILYAAKEWYNSTDCENWCKNNNRTRKNVTIRDFLYQ